MTENQISQGVQLLRDSELRREPLSVRHPDPLGIIYDHYHHVSRMSQFGLVCVGDSYTWGAGLEGRPPNQDQRRAKMFGAQLADRIGSDLINVGGGGYSNCWCLANLESMIDWLNTTDWIAGCIVITFTEHARDVGAYASRPFDYCGSYKHLPVDIDLYERVLQDIESEWIQRLQQCRLDLDTRFQIICGQNFVWHQRLYEETQIPGITWIPLTWLEHLADHIGKSPPPRIRMVHPDFLASVNNILSITDQSAWKKWLVAQTDDVQSMVDWMADTPEFFEAHDLGHPNAAGHKIWADVVHKVLTSSIRVANPIERAAAAHRPYNGPKAKC